MSMHRRPMQRADVRRCVAMLAQHPVIGARYGREIENLGEALLRVLGSEAIHTVVIETAGAHPQICFVGVTAMVRDDFLRELQQPRSFWCGPELARRILRGDSPVLTDREVREANTRGGLNMLSWDSCVRPGFETDNELHRIIMQATLEEHVGYQWKELIAPEMESVERLLWTLETGGLLWDTKSRRYSRSLPGAPETIIQKPHLIGIAKSVELKRAGSWIGALFDYRAPRMGFTAAEQRLLRAALSGGTDQEISAQLKVARLTVKNTWRSIYERAEAAIPRSCSIEDDSSPEKHERGKEKRRRLLGYRLSAGTSGRAAASRATASPCGESTGTPIISAAAAITQMEAPRESGVRSATLLLCLAAQDRIHTAPS